MLKNIGEYVAVTAAEDTQHNVPAADFNNEAVTLVLSSQRVCPGSMVLIAEWILCLAQVHTSITSH